MNPQGIFIARNTNVNNIFNNNVQIKEIFKILIPIKTLLFRLLAKAIQEYLMMNGWAATTGIAM